jgi:hypothetical protein
MTIAARDAWPELAHMLAAAPTAQVLRGGSAEDLGLLGLSEQSYLGAMVAHTGGITVDHGWLRLLGGAGADLPSLVDVAEGSSGYCAVGFDVLGGVFALDGGAFGPGDGHVHYFAPDSLDWEDLEITHGQFLTAMLTDSIGQFYESFRWAGWREEIAVLALDRGVSLYPPLSTAEGKHPNLSSRRAVPMAELVGEHWPNGAQDEDRQNG